MAAVVLTNVHKAYGHVVAVKDINLDIKDREFVVLVGPSGCGKSTTLRMIAGLEEISGGTIAIGGRIVNHLQPKDRDIAMVFQNYALYQHMSVRDNLAFGLRNRRVPEAEIAAAVSRAARILSIEPLLERRPYQLSGGQQQRVALGRCIVRNPLVFLFDEPLSNLDAKLRAQMRLEIKRLHSRMPTTSVFVTHDQVEAMTLGDRVVVMRDGRIQQVGTPLAIYVRPVNRFVAGFIGAPTMNFVDVTVTDDATGLHVEAPGLRLSVSEERAKALEPRRGRRVVMGLRPEHLALGDAAVAGRTFDAKVEVVEQLGSEMLLEVRVAEARMTVARVIAEAAIAPGDQIRLSAPPGRLHFFDPESEIAI